MVVLFLLTVTLQNQELSSNEDAPSAQSKPSAKTLHKTAQKNSSILHIIVLTVSPVSVEEEAWQ